jgi:hypothetical protein
MLRFDRPSRTIPGISWRNQDQVEVDQLGVLANRNGVLFVRRRQGRIEWLFVPYTFTRTEFSGWRAWFQCKGCGKGCRVLYGTASLRCRRCRRLKYQSQYETSSGFRKLQRARKIRRRLGRPGGAGDPFPVKPRHHALEEISPTRTAGLPTGGRGLGGHFRVHDRHALQVDKTKVSPFRTAWSAIASSMSACAGPPPLANGGFGTT